MIPLKLPGGARGLLSNRKWHMQSRRIGAVALLLTVGFVGGCQSPGEKEISRVLSCNNGVFETKDINYTKEDDCVYYRFTSTELSAERIVRKFRGSTSDGGEWAMNANYDRTFNDTGFALGDATLENTARLYDIVDRDGRNFHPEEPIVIGNFTYNSISFEIDEYVCLGFSRYWDKTSQGFEKRIFGYTCSKSEMAGKDYLRDRVSNLEFDESRVNMGN